MGITFKNVAQYTLMPQVLPRINALFLTGFGTLAYAMALVYRGVNILPPLHPIFARENRATLTLHGVIFAAYRELTFTRNNIDKIFIFFFLLIGLVLFALQFFSLLFFLAVNPALAGGGMPTSYGGFFKSPFLSDDYASQDVAYRMLWAVFGVPELFRPGAARTEFHTALHGLFQFYSIGLLVIAVIIICYYIFAVIAETAETGVPFGKRYNKVWAPLRLVIGLGLLIPIGYGLNSAQWITLYSAKFGSDFASRGWDIFTEKMAGGYLNNPNERVGTPKPPDANAYVAFMFTALACQKAYEIADQTKPPDDRRPIQAYVVSQTAATSPAGQRTLSMAAGDIQNLLNERRDILIRFGHESATRYNRQVANIMPFCGDMMLLSGEGFEDGSRHIQAFYLRLTADIWGGAYGLRDQAHNMVLRSYPNRRGDPNAPEVPANFRDQAVDTITSLITAEINQAVRLQASSPRWREELQATQRLGWGGAGTWYNKIASLNGTLVAAVNNIPQARQMPLILDYIQAEQAQQNRNIPRAFRPSLPNNRQMQFNVEEDREIGTVLSGVYEFWTANGASFGALSSHRGMTGNIFVDAINAIFGTQGLFAMCQNTDVHPLAQLSQLGKGLIEASIRNIALGVGFSLVGILPIPFLGQAMTMASGILLSIASITVVMGFILFYIMPFMPFLYFFFAVGGWIKGLFDAMVGVPLWALAHLKIDGDGLPGDAAMQGYYLIFEIFLRPIMVLFGLLASVVIFAAMVKVLNEIFYLVVNNLSGHDPNSRAVCGSIGTRGPSFTQNPIEFIRGPIDEFFFTVIYAILVYMIGMSCFKLIDLVPNNILRYMGSQATTFQDKAADPAEGLISRLAVGGGIVSNQIFGEKGMVTGLTGAARNAVQGVVQAAGGLGGGAGGGGGGGGARQ